MVKTASMSGFGGNSPRGGAVAVTVFVTVLAR
jgi:hypothetical protein